MSGYPFSNFPAFDAVADELRSRGHVVANPADHDRALEAAGVAEPSRRDFARWDVDRIFESDFIVLLPGHERSLGATAELALARWIGLKVAYATLPAAGILIQEEKS